MNTVKGELQGCRANELLYFGCFKQHTHSLEKEVPLRLRVTFALIILCLQGSALTLTSVWGRQRQADGIGIPTQQKTTMPNTAHNHSA